MQTTLSQIQHLAALAYIDIDEKYAKKLAHDVGEIMEYVEQLRQVDTTEVTPLFHPLDMQQRLRPDVVSHTNAVTALAAIAPCFDNEQHVYLVPKIINTGS